MNKTMQCCCWCSCAGSGGRSSHLCPAHRAGSWLPCAGKTHPAVVGAAAALLEAEETLPKLPYADGICQLLRGYGGAVGYRSWKRHHGGRDLGRIHETKQFLRRAKRL